jgi:putative transcriptional regulator
LRYKDFCRILTVAENTNRKDALYIEMGACGISDEDSAQEALDLIWAMKYARINVKHIRKVTQLSQARFAQKYEIPLSTYEQWEMEKRTPPAYVYRLLAWAVFSDLYGMSTEEKWEYHEE